MEVAILSGKGGTGKSSICAAFIAIAKSVVAVDCDVDTSNLHLLLAPQKESEEVYISGYHAEVSRELCIGCAQCARYCRFEAASMVKGKAAINEVLCEGCNLCARLCVVKAIRMVPSNKSRMYTGSFTYGTMVYGYLAPGEENSGKLISKLRTRARELADQHSFTTILLDGPPGISCPAISTITGVDKVVIVTEPSLSGLQDMQRTVEVVRKFSIPVYVLINKYDLNLSVCLQLEDWCVAEGIPVVGKLPFDNQLVAAMLSGKSIVEYNGDAEVSQLIRKAYADIMHA